MDAFRKNRLTVPNRYDAVWMCDPGDFLRYGDAFPGYEPIRTPRELENLVATIKTSLLVPLTGRMIPEENAYRTTFQKHLRHAMLDTLKIRTLPTLIVKKPPMFREDLGFAVRDWWRHPTTQRAVRELTVSGVRFVGDTFVVKSAVGYASDGNTFVRIEDTNDKNDDGIKISVLGNDNLDLVVGVEGWPCVVQPAIADFTEYKVAMPWGCKAPTRTYEVHDDTHKIALDDADDFTPPNLWKAFKNFARDSAGVMIMDMPHVRRFLRLDVFVPNAIEATDAKDPAPFIVNEFDTINSGHTYAIGLTLVDIDNLIHGRPIGTASSGSNSNTNSNSNKNAKQKISIGSAILAFQEETDKDDRKAEYRDHVRPALDGYIDGVMHILKTRGRKI